jgi:hypothetical protein
VKEIAMREHVRKKLIGPEQIRARIPQRNECSKVGDKRLNNENDDIDNKYISDDRGKS